MGSVPNGTKITQRFGLGSRAKAKGKTEKEERR
jgi:hypothetical protein